MDTIKIRANRNDFHLSMHNVKNIPPTEDAVRDYLKRFKKLGLKDEDLKNITIEDYQPDGEWRNKWKQTYIVKANGAVVAFTNGKFIVNKE